MVQQMSLGCRFIHIFRVFRFADRQIRTFISTLQGAKINCGRSFHYQQLYFFLEIFSNMSSTVNIIIPTTLPDASQLSCLQNNASIPAPPLLNTTSLSTCSISSFVISADNLLSTCCNTTDHVVVSPYKVSTSNDLVTTGGYSANGCDWTYCNVTGQSGIKEFGKCVSETAPEVEAQCFLNGVSSPIT